MGGARGEPAPVKRGIWDTLSPSTEFMSQSRKGVIPGEPKDCGRDPESRKIVQYRIILDPPPLLAGDDRLLQSLSRERRV